MLLLFIVLSEYPPPPSNEFMARGGTRNFPTEGLELQTGGLKLLKNGVSVGYFAKFPPNENLKFPPTGGLDASDGGL